MIENTYPHSVTDIAAFALIARMYPEDQVYEALNLAGCVTYRLRSLPMEFMFYMAVAFGLHKNVGAHEAYRIVLDGYDNIYGKKGAESVTDSAIHQARKKLGFEPLKIMFEKTCKPLAAHGTKGSFFKSWRLVAIDGCYINLADSKANEEAFGRPTNKGKSNCSYPQLKLVCLAECGTHTIFAMKTGRYDDSELVIGREVISSLSPDQLCLADRLYFGFETWKLACSTGAALLWRARNDHNFHPQEYLEDGSFTALFFQSSRSEGESESPILLRVIEFERPGTKAEKGIIRLVTNILDPSLADAVELAKLYCQRWEIEIMYGELKVKLNDNLISLRPTSPILVKQEVYGLVMAHSVVRKAIYEAATARKSTPYDPDVFSFVGAVNIIRRKARRNGAFSP